MIISMETIIAPAHPIVATGLHPQRHLKSTPVQDKSRFFHALQISTSGKFDGVSNGPETDSWTISLLNKGAITARRPS